ncbi:MAG: hypothetical protein LBT59_06365 [Clostridiales bacterium]|nr:hypothetical protein [Clostridiales bacterium]
MLSQAIWTRCAKGRELLTDGRASSGGGFKTYSFSREITDKTYGPVDLEHLKEALGAEAPYDKVAAKKDSAAAAAGAKNGEFLEDAFSYVVPEFGLPFLTDFTVRIFVAGVNDRPGNFIRQAFVGKLDGHPASYINSSSFTAKNYDELFYYQPKSGDTPDYLPCVESLDPNPDLGFEQVGAFIRQGNRKQKLHAAVWFLLKQHELRPEERKYIIIKGTAAEIEKWIAAITYALSPDMAQMVPFATRLSKPATDNKYNVTPDGRLSRSLNAPIRRKAMLVGVDIRDSGIRDVRPTPNSPYVVLDEIQPNTQVSHPYFDLISRFDSDHYAFVNDFLRIRNGSFGMKMMLDSYDSFNILRSGAVGADPQRLLYSLRLVKETRIPNIPGWQAAKDSIVAGVDSGNYTFEAAKLAIDIDRTRGTQDESFLAALCDCMTKKFIGIASGAPQKTQPTYFRNAYSKEKELMNCLDDAKTLFAETGFHKTFCANVVDLSAEKVSFEPSSMPPHEASSSIGAFLDAYVGCMATCGISLANKNAERFCSREITKLLNCETNSKSYQSIALSALNRLQSANPSNIECLIKSSPPESKLRKFLKLNMGLAIEPIGSLRDLATLCASKTKEGITSDELEYFLAEYALVGQFKSDALASYCLPSLLRTPLAKGHPLPNMIGYHMYEKCIERSDDSAYGTIIDEFMKAPLSAETKCALLNLIDGKLYRFLPKGAVTAFAFSNETLPVKLANKVIDSDSSHLYHNSRLIALLNLSSGEFTLKQLLSPSFQELHLPNAEYGNALISLAKNQNLSFEEHLAYLSLFAENSEIYRTFLADYLAMAIDEKSTKLFMDFSRLCLKDHNSKTVSEIFGEGARRNAFSRALPQALAHVYSQNLSKSQTAITSIKKLIGKDENLAAFCQDNFGLNDMPESKASVSHHNPQPERAVPSPHSGYQNFRPQPPKPEQKKKTGFFGNLIGSAKNALKKGDNE